MLEEGKVQVYTGNGKGKTTAALGLAVRSLCAGNKVVIGQFIKGMDYSELKLPDHFDRLSLEQFGRDCFVYRKPTDQDYQLASRGLEKMRAYLQDPSIDLLIFDEINVACEYKLIDPREVVEMIKKRPKTMEVVLTGRYAPQEFIDLADLVTEMKEIKHYYKQQGLKARLGIEY